MQEIKDEILKAFQDDVTKIIMNAVNQESILLLGQQAPLEYEIFPLLVQQIEEVRTKLKEKTDFIFLEIVAKEADKVIKDFKGMNNSQKGHMINIVKEIIRSYVRISMRRLLEKNQLGILRRFIQNLDMQIYVNIAAEVKNPSPSLRLIALVLLELQIDYSFQFFIEKHNDFSIYKIKQAIQIFFHALDEKVENILTNCQQLILSLHHALLGTDEENCDKQQSQSEFLPT